MVAGVGVVDCEGLRRGVVVDLDRTSVAIRAAIAAAERSAGQPWPRGDCYMTINGAHLRGDNPAGVVSVARPEAVTVEDVIRAVEAAREAPPAREPDREVVQMVPRIYRLDEQGEIRDPVGMAGHRLEVLAHRIIGSSAAVQNLLRCVRSSGLGVEELVFSGLAASESVLTDGERELGVALLDVGGGTTAVTVVRGGAIAHSAVVPVGGHQVTGDLAAGLRTTLDVAETVKVSVGHTSPAAITAEEIVPVRGLDGQVRPVKRKLVAEIVEPRVQELFGLAGRHLQAAGGTERLPGGVVLTGGGSLLAGSVEVAAAVFACPVRRGVPSPVGGLGDQVRGPAFAAAVGLLDWVSSARDPAVGGSAPAAEPLGPLTRALRLVRDLF
jgi:cell division protein FtsA